MVEKLNKKSKSSNVKPFMVKNHLWVFINAQIENPAFDSQVSGNVAYQVLVGPCMQVADVLGKVHAAAAGCCKEEPQ